MVSTYFRTLALAAAIGAVPFTVSAQAARQPVAAKVVRGPTLGGASSAVRAQVQRTTTTAPGAIAVKPTGRGVPLMIVGGAAVLGGAIIGDTPGTLIAVGGLVVGLYGLYQYLQ